MTTRNKSFLWAAIIVSGALISVGMGLTDGASFGIICGLSGVALGSLSSGDSCGRSLMQ
jgi:hypothetical protein